MNIIEAARSGKRFRRKWKEPDDWRDDGWIYYESDLSFGEQYVDDREFPFSPTLEDILADDWEIKNN